LPNATSLKEIYFNNNEIEEIPADLFKNATNLNDISFSDNKIKKLPNNLLPNATSLSSIYLNNNEIEEIPADLFKNATNLVAISFVSFDKDIIDSFWIILFKNYIKKIIKQNVDNEEFKFYSSKSLEAIFERNHLNLIETFFKNEIADKPVININNQFISEGFYFDIDFVKCFEIIFKNSNEKMAIYLIRILKYIYKRFNENYANEVNILKIHHAFSFSWIQSRKQDIYSKKIDDEEDKDEQVLE
jgi:hypothetical protein